jgi:hypothetical protein
LTRKGKHAQSLIVKLRKQTALSGNIASNREWDRTLSIAYQLGLRYFGVQGDTPAAQVPAALNRLGVDYYFVWNGTAAEHQQFKNCPEITGGTLKKLHVYQLASPPPTGH